MQIFDKGEPWSESDGAVVHVVAALGFACLIGWELSVVFAPSLPLLSFCSLSEAVFLRVVSVLAFALSYLLYAYRADWAFVHRNRIFTAGALLALLTVANTCVNMVFGGVPLLVSVIAWVFIGFAQASIVMYWCVFLSLAPQFRLALVVPAGGLIGTFLYVFVNASGIVWVNLLGVVVMVFVSVGIAACLSARLPEEAILPVERYRHTSTISPKAAFSAACQGIVYGFMATQSCDMGVEAVVLVGASGLFGVLLALVWGLLGSRVDIDAGVIQRISLPPLVASMLLLPFFGEWGRIACACLANIALAHSIICIWYSTMEENHEFGLHPVKRFALRSAPSQGGFFVGAVVAFVFVYLLETPSEVLKVVMVVMAITVVTGFSVYGGDESKTKAQLNGLLSLSVDSAAELLAGRVGLPDAGLQALDFEGCCDRVASCYGLTPREGDVLRYLAKGRNAAFIAGALYVSPATVKSHIYHIYQKLGVSSQQKVIDIVDGYGDSE